MSLNISNLKDSLKEEIESLKKETINKFRARKTKLLFDEDEFEFALSKIYEKYKKENPHQTEDIKVLLNRDNNINSISEMIYKIMDYNIPLQKEDNSKLTFNNSKNCCLAPYSTLNFDTLGHMRVCCYNSYFILGKYPEDSIIDSWNNPKKQIFIDKLKQFIFTKGCENCGFQIKQKNASNALFSSFNKYDKQIKKDFPIALNFEFGTICNFECIMCGGKWSSSIRKNREKLPPLKSPYDESFVEQLSPFISSALYANFLGGEPFLNPIYYKILNSFLSKNKHAKINITTNGSIYNQKIESYLTAFENINITLSLDSLDEKNYEYIRKNGNYKTLIENIKKFKAIDKLRGIAVCPMIQNIYEIPNLVKFAFENNLHLSINSVFEHLGGKLKGIHENEDINEWVWIGDSNYMEKMPPQNNSELIPEVALHTLPKDKLKEIVEYLKKFSFIDNTYEFYNKKYKDFIKSLEFYLETSKA